VGENEYRQKSPGFGDLLRVDDNNIRHSSDGRYPGVLPIDSHNINVIDDDEKTIFGSVSIF